MSNSLKEFHLAESQPAPTSLEIPTMVSLKTIETIDEMLEHQNLDIESLCKQVLDVKKTLLSLDYKVGCFRDHAIRLLSLVKCIAEEFGVDCFYSPKLVGSVRYCSGKWKRILKNVLVSKANPSSLERFVYKAERNTYLLVMLRTFNKIVSKSVSKMNLNSRLNAKSKKYLKTKGIGRHYNATFKNILVVLEEKEEETYLKVLLINEFCRFSLNYVHLCTSEKEENSVFDNFYLLVIYLCRIIKKFYGLKLQKIINESLKVICSGFELYTNIFCCRGGKYKAKVDQMNGLMTLVDETFNYRGKKEPNQNSFVIRFLSKVVFGWKKIHLKAEKEKSSHDSKAVSEFSMAKFMRKEREKSLKQSLYNNTKQSEFQVEVVKINKSLSQLHRRKSETKNILAKLNQFQKASAVKVPPLKSSNKLNMNRREGNLSLSKLKIYSRIEERSVSIQKMRQARRAHVNEEEKELKIEDYVSFYNSQKKSVQSINRIQLYQAEKMANYCKGKKKVKLQLN